MNPRLLRLLLFGLAAVPLLTAAPASAASVVLYEGTDAATAAAAGKEALETGDFAITRLADVPGLPASGLTALGGSATACKSQGISLNDRIERATAQIDELDFEAALQTLADGADTAACTQGDITTAGLYNLFFLAGYANFFADRPEAAGELFARAAVIDPARPWDEAYPPTPKSAFLAALQTALASPGARLELPAGASSIDGTPVAMGQTPTVLAGLHVLDHDGARYLIDVPPASVSASVRLVDVADLRVALLRGEAWTAPWLTAKAADEGWDHVAVVGADGASVFRSGTWISSISALEAQANSTGTGTTFKARRPGPSGRQVAGLVLAAGGAAASVGGIVGHVRAYNQGNSLLGGPDTNVDLYQTRYTENQAAFWVAVGGGALTVTGVILAAVPDRNARATASGTALPWVSGGPGGVAVGVSGGF